MSESSVRPAKLRMTVAYDGAKYAGWQVQKVGLGVQDVIERALLRISPAGGRLHGSSRTDAGVHALGMVCHVEIPGLKLAPDKLLLALNAHLPEDIRILDARRCSANFHARFDAKAKQYRYFVWNHRAANPLMRHQAWHVPRPLDLDAMRLAAAAIPGKRDFKAFAANRDYEMETTVRTVHRCDIRREGPLLTFVIEGDGFLYKMCRGIVGTLVQVGYGKYQPNAVKQMLDAQDRRASGMTAPAHGLVLWKVFYARRAR